MKEIKKTLIITAEMAKQLDSINEQLNEENKETRKEFYSRYSFISDIMRHTYTTKSAKWTQDENGEPIIKITEKENYADLLKAVKTIQPSAYDTVKKDIETLEKNFALFVSQSVDSKAKTTPSNTQLIKLCDKIIADTNADNTTKILSIDVKYLVFIATRKGRGHGEITGKARKALNDMLYCKYNGIRYTFTDNKKATEDEPKKTPTAPKTATKSKTPKTAPEQKTA